MTDRAQQLRDCHSFLHTLKELRNAAEADTQHPDFSRRKSTIEKLERDVSWLCGSYASTLPAGSSVNDITAALRRLEYELKEQRAAVLTKGDPYAQHKIVQIETEVVYLTERLARKILKGEDDTAETAEIGVKADSDR